jgi:hypothetical protein
MLIADTVAVTVTKVEFTANWASHWHRGERSSDCQHPVLFVLSEEELAQLVNQERPRGRSTRPVSFSSSPTSGKPSPILDKRVCRSLGQFSKGGKSTDDQDAVNYGEAP